jgi:radical SAM superfamily enzyme YgiQ (UPF0313 family)
MKVLIISANTETNPYPVYPIGIDYVAGAIRNDHHVCLLDMNAIDNMASFKERILDIDPGIVGISIRNVDNTDVLSPKGFIGKYRKLINTIREFTNAPVVLGGSGLTIFPEKMIKALQADFGIIGEGERFAGFLNALEKNEDVTRLPGVITKDTEEAIPPPWNTSLHRYFDADAPHVPYYLKQGGMMNLQTKRGCPFKCIYCTYPHIEGNKLRLTPPKKVAETALMLQAAGAKFLFITDSAFNSDYPYSIEVALEFQKAKLSIPWGAFISPTHPPKDYYKILADAGMTHVEFGTDSLSDDILSSCKKPFRCKDVFHAHKVANKAGLHVCHFFLFGAPGESPSTVRETLLNAEKLEQTVLFLFFGMRIYPYTRLFDIALASGQIAENEDLLDPRFFNLESISLNEIEKTVKERANQHPNWVAGAGEELTDKIVSRLHARGHVGPLWEYLIK